MNKLFNNQEEVIAEYMQDYKISKDKVDAYYHNQDNMKLFCIKIVGVKGKETLKYYRVTRSGKYHLYLD